MPALKIFTGSTHDAAPEDRTRWTLRQAFEQVTLPRLKRRQRAPGSVEKYKRAVWYWEQATDDPAIGRITADDLDEFVELLAEPGRWALRTATAANQQLGYVEAILRSCGPRIGRNGGAGILTEVPAGERLPTEAPTKRRRLVPLEHLDAIYRACRVATWPRVHGLPAPLLWRVAFVLAYNVGPRRCELFKMPASADRPQAAYPGDADDIEATSPHGWLAFPTPKTARRKQQLPLVVPVNLTTRQHLDAIRTGTRRLRLLPMGDHASTWRRHSFRIQTAAGIGEPYTWQDLRKTASRAYRRTAGRDVAEFILGHKPRGTNATFYDDLTADAVAAVERLPQPAAFLEGVA